MNKLDNTKYFTKALDICLDVPNKNGITYKSHTVAAALSNCAKRCNGMVPITTNPRPQCCISHEDIIGHVNLFDFMKEKGKVIISGKINNSYAVDQLTFHLHGLVTKTPDKVVSILNVIGIVVLPK